MIAATARARQPALDAVERRHRAQRIALPVLAVTGAAERLIRAAAGRLAAFAWLAQLHQPEDPRHLVGVHVEQPGALVVRGSAPLGAAVEAGEDDRALRARRRPRAAALRGQPRSRTLARRLGRQVGDLIFREQLSRERRRRLRHRLRRRGGLALEVGRRHRLLLHREQRRAGLAIEHVDVAGLGRLRDRGDRAAAAPHRHQHGRLRQVAIPDVVADELVVPDVGAGLGLQYQQAVRVEVVALAVAAPEVERRRSGRQEHQARARDRW